MDLKRFSVTGKVAAASLLLCLLSAPAASANLVFQVQNKFKDGERSLGALRAHDDRRHGRLLSEDLDLFLGGNGNPSQTGLYFAKIGLGTPPKDYYVQVDTGSDVLWVNCVNCDGCPTKTETGFPLTQYDLKGSSTGSTLNCGQDFCHAMYNTTSQDCKPDTSCTYSLQYGDGTMSAGYFVNDKVRLDQVSGNLQSSSTFADVVFGCTAKQTGGSSHSNQAFDGIAGFGQSNSSMLSQLAAVGKVKKIFAHCLDSIHGGGIFTIGQVVDPKVNTTKLIPNQAHYTLEIKAMEVGSDPIEFSKSFFDFGIAKDLFGSGGGEQAIIDSGTTLAYLPGNIYDQVMAKIVASQSGLKLRTVQDKFTCFDYSDDVDKGFPIVKFEFDNSLILSVYPHDYLFQIENSGWCFGWQTATMQSKDGKDVALLGDLVLSNKLVVYDLENQAIGWVEYNCSSSIKVKDESTGAEYTVGTHSLKSDSSMMNGRTSILMFFLILALFTQKNI